ncbi:HPr(Ser) kinase/phosphatase [Thermosediminibacter litoriperuensis]|uniref:HPr kinase/phosphorylase n=1 Tax=Thermosediminibacter litoriperuensis TaxID=291989 RepID=A0A5S5AXR0_9FIRM|nr:HPr(Ser) kinase/phosphatase [Thermosediminibacter litoriperuensis]TYP56689.1 Hpr(Ser) kinase/phosphatase [Thermosediminibacter litoriperuensis]
MRKINLSRVIDKFDMEILVKVDNLPDIYVIDLNRPGLELAGFFDYFAFERIQILGMTEISFLESLAQNLRRERLERLLSYDLPCIIITRNLNPPEELLDLAEKYGRCILRTPEATTRLISRLTDFLESEMAPRTTVHGVLMDIYGVGVLLLGESGIGKSETAIELIKRGHRLVADDAVEIKQVAKNVLIGMAPEIIRYYLEVRGLGIIDVKTVFGAGAVKDDIRIDMVVELVEWEKYKEGDRLGLQEERITILESSIPKKTIPIRPGRNLAAIIEVAAMDHRLKAMGHNAALLFTQKLFSKIQEEKND